MGASVIDRAVILANLKTLNERYRLVTLDDLRDGATILGLRIPLACLQDRARFEQEMVMPSITLQLASPAIRTTGDDGSFSLGQSTHVHFHVVSMAPGEKPMKMDRCLPHLLVSTQVFMQSEDTITTLWLVEA